MKEQIEAFIEFMYKQKGASENTRLSYKRDLLKMQQYLEEKGIVGFREVSEKHLQTYKKYLEAQNFKAATISRHLASIKALFRYLAEKGVIEKDVSEGLVAPRVKRKSPEIVSVTEAERLLAQPDGNTPKELRDKAMLELLYTTGIGVTELLSLQLADVDLCRGNIVCYEGNKEKIVPVGQNAMISLLRYLHMGRESLMGEKECRRVFVNCKGTEMSRQGFWKLLKSYADKAELDCEITPHLLGHSMAAHSGNK